jgi:hypothetical protein
VLTLLVILHNFAPAVLTLLVILHNFAHQYFKMESLRQSLQPLT